MAPFLGKSSQHWFLIRTMRMVLTSLRLGENLGASLAESKKDLEKEKLRLEINELRRSAWTRPHVIAALVGGMLAIVATLSSNWFTDKVDKLTSTIQTLELKQQELSNVNAQLSKKATQLERTKSCLKLALTFEENARKLLTEDYPEAFSRIYTPLRVEFEKEEKRLQELTDQGKLKPHDLQISKKITDQKLKVLGIAKSYQRADLDARERLLKKIEVARSEVYTLISGELNCDDSGDEQVDLGVIFSNQ